MQYFSTFIPGLQPIIDWELKRKLKNLRIDALINGIVIFETESKLKDVQNLKSVEDNFALLYKFENLPKNPLSLIEQAVEKEDYLGNLKNAIGVKRHYKVKVFTRMWTKFPFERRDLQSVVEKILSQKSYIRLIDKNKAEIEFWFFLRGRLGLLGLRITDEKVKYRGYKIESIPGSLKPQAAYAMAVISEPEKTDVVLDPLCGVGTILIERAQNSPYQKVFGGDIDLEVVKKGKKNIKKAGVDIEVFNWDATDLKEVASDSIDKIITNPPWGKTVDKTYDYNIFYPKILREFRRILKSNGLLILLTSEKALFEKLIRDNKKHFKLMQQLNIFVSGQKAGIYKLRRL